MIELLKSLFNSDPVRDQEICVQIATRQLYAEQVKLAKIKGQVDPPRHVEITTHSSPLEGNE